MNRWQVRDIVLFGGAVIAMYKYGHLCAEAVEKTIPTEEEMQKMFEEA